MTIRAVLFLLFFLMTIANVCSAGIIYQGGSDVLNTTLTKVNISELSDITNAPKSNNPIDEIHWYGGSLVLDTALGEKPYPPDINITVITPPSTPTTVTPTITETPTPVKTTPAPNVTTTIIKPVVTVTQAGGKAIINVDSEPKGIEIYLNGKFYGRTPAKIEVEPKKYTIELYKEGYDVYTYMLTAEPNKEYTLYVTMRKEQPKQYDPTFGGKFREPPTVTLHLVKDRFEPGEQGIIELNIRNPSVNDIALAGELNIKVPSNLAVEGGDVVGGGGYYSSTFIAKPGTSRTQTLYITCLDAEPGRYLIHAKVYYYPEGDKDNYHELTLIKPIEIVLPPPTPIPIKQEYLIVLVAIVGIVIVAVVAVRRRPPKVEIIEE